MPIDAAKFQNKCCNSEQTLLGWGDSWQWGIDVTNKSLKHQWFAVSSTLLPGHNQAAGKDARQRTHQFRPPEVWPCPLCQSCRMKFVIQSPLFSAWMIKSTTIRSSQSITAAQAGGARTQTHNEIMNICVCVCVLHRNA